MNTTTIIIYSVKALPYINYAVISYNVYCTLKEIYKLAKNIKKIFNN